MHLGQTPVLAKKRLPLLCRTSHVTRHTTGLLQDYPGPIAALSAQFPDPHFKKRHRKRRMVQPSVVQVARDLLVPGGEGRRT
jgi:tRNA G46 methylase TrmB